MMILPFKLNPKLKIQEQNCNESVFHSFSAYMCQENILVGSTHFFSTPFLFYPFSTLSKEKSYFLPVLS